MNYQISANIKSILPDSYEPSGRVIGLLLTMQMGQYEFTCIGGYRWTNLNKTHVDQLPSYVGKRASCILGLLSQTGKPIVAVDDSISFYQEFRDKTQITGRLTQFLNLATDELSPQKSKFLLIDCGFPVLFEPIFPKPKIGSYLQCVRNT